MIEYFSSNRMDYALHEGHFAVFVKDIEPRIQAKFEDCPSQYDNNITIVMEIRSKL